MYFTVEVLYLTAIAKQDHATGNISVLNGLFNDDISWEDYVLSVKLMWQRISILKRMMIIA